MLIDRPFLLVVRRKCPSLRLMLCWLIRPAPSAPLHQQELRTLLIRKATLQQPVGWSHPLVGDWITWPPEPLDSQVAALATHQQIPIRAIRLVAIDVMDCEYQGAAHTIQGTNREVGSLHKLHTADFAAPARALLCRIGNLFPQCRVFAMRLNRPAAPVLTHSCTVPLQ